MDITYNGLSNPSGLICFTDVPNIVKVSDPDNGTYGGVEMLFKTGLTATGNSQYFITILDNTIVNVLDPMEAVGQNFYVGSDVASTAFSVARALRSCPNVIANYDVMHNGEDTVQLIARQSGSIFNQYAIPLQVNIPSQYLVAYTLDGSSTSVLHNANVSVDIYSPENEHLGILEKNVHGGEVAFDISSMLSSVSEYGKLRRFAFRVAAVSEDGKYYNLKNFSVNHITQGYKTKDSADYLNLSSTPQIALATDRGTSRNVFNNTLLYVYDPTIPITVYTTSGSVGYSITYYDSAFGVLGTGTGSASVVDNVADINITLNPSYYTPDCFYVDITIGSDTVRYNVIKPIRLTEGNTRIYWRNELGGIQFFDFTGQKSETRNRDTSTFHRGNAIFDYYGDSFKNYEGVYAADVEEKINVASHLFEKDGRWQFDSMARCKMAWTYVDGIKYGVIIDSVSVDETEQNDIYTATVQYHTTEVQ